VIVKNFTFAISSPDEFLLFNRSCFLDLPYSSLYRVTHRAPLGVMGAGFYRVVALPAVSKQWRKLKTLMLTKKNHPLDVICSCSTNLLQKYWEKGLRMLSAGCRIQTVAVKSRHGLYSPENKSKLFSPVTGKKEWDCQLILRGLGRWFPWPSVHWHCWFGDQKGMWTMRNLCHLFKGSLMEQAEKKWGLANPGAHGTWQLNEGSE